jgi:hypothetical protein
MKKTIVIALLILCAGGILAMAQGPPQTWTWTVAVTDAENLVGDGSDYSNSGNVYVGVSKLTKSAYRFRLHIWNGSDRHISTPVGAGSFDDVYLNTALGPGYFPVVESCVRPTPLFCDNESGCSGRLANFLALSHPVCSYESVLLQITVPLDIERLNDDGREVRVNGDVRLTIVNTNDILQAPDEAFHNMDALTLPTGKAPLLMTRMGPNSWRVRVNSPNLYMNYGEFYFGYLRKRPGDNKISMLVDGPFIFDTTWTRE